MKKILLTALALSLLVPAAADRYEDYVRATLNEVGAYYANSYMRLGNLDSTGMLAAGRFTTYRLTLVAGRTYRIAGVCDQECDDIDLELRDENNNLIAADQTNDYLAYVDVTPKWTGEFTLKITMDHCLGNPGCVYGTTILRRR